MTKTAPAQLAHLLYEYRVKDVVVSPGSRNAPIITALARSKRYKLHYIVDERQAAFVALGMSVATDRPVALVCTSGSAVLNYGPALAEAYYSHVPLIAISADRPYYEIEQNRPQTIRQAHIFDHITGASVDLREGEPDAYGNRLINQALNVATGNPKLPVHINVQLDMPLSCEQPLFAPCTRIPMASLPSMTPVELDPGSKYLLLIGGLAPDNNIATCGGLIENLPANVAVVAEAQSNLSQYSTITAAAFEAGVKNNGLPDCLMVAGSPLVSPFLQSLVDNGEIPCYHIDPTGRQYPSPTILTTLTRFLASVRVGHGRVSDYRRRLGKIEAAVPSPVSRLIGRIAGSDVMLHLSNGMTIREAQKVPIPAATHVWCNRGVSGIDGSVSTAIGSALASDKQVILVSGDMSAAYDISALSIGGLGANFTMIVVNNNGGEIFRRVKTTRDLPEREEYFTAMPKFPLKALAEAYGFDFSSATDPDEIDLSPHEKPHIIEFITTP